MEDKEKMMKDESDTQAGVMNDTPETEEETEAADTADVQSEEENAKEAGMRDPAPDAAGQTAEDSPAEEEEPADADKEEKQEKDSLFSKRKKNKKDPKDERIGELTDKYTRLMAEFENFRKRTEKEKSQMFETGAKSIIESILPVIDSFELGLKAIPEEEALSAVADGMHKIYKQLMSALEKAGVTVIEAEGKEFDPNLHNAMMTVEDAAGLGSNMVAAELQKGYKYRDQVVRHSMVSVTN